MNARYHAFLILPEFDGPSLGRIHVGVPQDQIRELKERFPFHEIRGEDRALQIAIQGGITEAEKVKILEALDLSRGTPIKFQILSVPTIDIAPPNPPTFISDGRFFWVSPEFHPTRH
jgi:hypothetical protein